MSGFRAVAKSSSCLRTTSTRPGTLFVIAPFTPCTIYWYIKNQSSCDICYKVKGWIYFRFTLYPPITWSYFIVILTWAFFNNTVFCFSSFSITSTTIIFYNKFSSSVDPCAPSTLFRTFTNIPLAPNAIYCCSKYRCIIKCNYHNDIVVRF